MKSNTYKIQYKYKNSFAQFWSTYKALLLLCFVFLVFGLSLGIFKSIKYSGDLTLSNLSDSNFVEFLKGDRGTMGLFFPCMFGFLFFSGIIIFVNFKPFCKIFTFLILIIKGYLIGFDITILIVQYGISGVLNVFIFILPFDLMICLILIFLSAIAIKRNNIIKKYGCNSCCSNFNYKKVYWALVIVGVVIILLKCLLLPLVKVTIIVV